jgi:hypothetical protein
MVHRQKLSRIVKAGIRKLIQREQIVPPYPAEAAQHSPQAGIATERTPRD